MIRRPSVKTLGLVFDNPTEARRILGLSRGELRQHPAGAARHGECHTPPTTEDIRMHVLNSLDPGLHGVEAFKLKRGWVDYLNTGETYAATLIRHDGRYRVQSVGDFIERQERRGNRDVNQ